MIKKLDSKLELMNDLDIKLEISPVAKIIGEIDLTKLGEVIKSTELDLGKAVMDSMKVTLNLLNWKEDYIAKVLFAEIDWAAVFLNFRWREENKMYFKICPIRFENKIEYQRYAKSPNFSKVILKGIIKNGNGYVVINSFNPNPEHNIDMWLSKSIFPYPENKWKKVLQ